MFEIKGKYYIIVSDYYSKYPLVKEIPCPVTSTAVTRASDNLSIDAGNIPDPTADYSVSALVDILGVNSTTQRVMKVAGEVNRAMSAQQSGFVSAFNGSTSIFKAPAVAEAEKLGLTIDTTDALNGFKLYRGGLFEAEAAITNATGSKTKIDIGSDGGSAFLFGHIKDFRTYNVALDAAQVRSL